MAAAPQSHAVASEVYCLLRAAASCAAGEGRDAAGKGQQPLFSLVLSYTAPLIHPPTQPPPTAHVCVHHDCGICFGATALYLTPALSSHHPPSLLWQVSVSKEHITIVGDGSTQAEVVARVKQIKNLVSQASLFA